MDRGRRPTSPGFLRRWLGRAFLVLVIGGLALAIVAFREGEAPFTAVASSSMSPALERGDLVWVKPVDPTALAVGDIVVVRVPGYIQDRYGYPPLLVHRVSQVDTSTGRPLYRLKGDRNSGEDPFTVRPEDVRGAVGKVVRYAGYPVLFFSSPQGVAFLLVCAALFALYAALEWFDRRRERLDAALRGLLAPALRQALEESDVGRSAGRDGRVEEALLAFASAMGEYAVHLRSHTAAVEDLARGASGLREAIAYQIELLAALHDRIAGDSKGAAPARLLPPTESEVALAPPLHPAVRRPELSAPLEGASTGTFVLAPLPSRAARRRAARRAKAQRRRRRAIAALRGLALLATLAAVLLIP